MVAMSQTIVYQLQAEGAIRVMWLDIEVPLLTTRYCFHGGHALQVPGSALRLSIALTL